MVASKNITELNELTLPEADDVLLIVERLSATSSEAKQIKWSNVLESINDIVAQQLIDDPNNPSTTSVTYDDVAGTIYVSVNDNSTTQKSIYALNGTVSATRQEANLIPSTGIAIAINDNGTDDRADITVTNQGLVSASNGDATDTHVDLISSTDTASDGSKDLVLRPLKSANTSLSIAESDSGESITLTLNAGNIDINDLNTTNPLAVSLGGTGASTAENARINLGTAKSGANNDITSITGLSTPLAVSQGGTGAQTASGGLQNLGGLDNVAGVGIGGENLVFQSKTLVSGAYRAELKGLKPTTQNHISIASDGNDIELGAVPNNILDGVSGVRVLNGARLTGASAPVGDNDLATKAYVDSQTTGLNIKESCQVATIDDLGGTYEVIPQTITASSPAALAIDGVSLDLNDRILVKDQTTGSENGIYVVTRPGDDVSTTWVIQRAPDFNSSSEIGAGSYTFVEQGDTHGGQSFTQTAIDPILDTDDIVFSVFGTSQIGPNSISNGKLAQMAEATVKGRAAATGTGNPIDMSADQLINVINAATSSTIDAARVSDPTESNTNARIAIFQQAETTAVGTRRALRFIEGADADFTIADDDTNEEVDITLAITSASTNTANRIVKRDGNGDFAANVITCVDLNSTSDAALKQNITPVDNAIELISQITGVAFDWAQDQRSSVGVLAQDVESVLPELVGSNEGHKTVNYNGLVGVLIQAVKELSEEVKALKK